MSNASAPEPAASGPTGDWLRLRRRSELLRQTRAFFQHRGFWEVETPLLSRETVVDRHLDPIQVPASGIPALAEARPSLGREGADRQEPPWFLQTSPELGMKRLLAAGADAIYQICRAFRQGERGALHNPEFTLLEWYRVGDDYAQGRQLLAALTRELLGRPVAERAYGELFAARWAVNPHRAASRELAQLAAAEGLAIPASYADADRDAWLELLFGERIQPRLGCEEAVIVYDYPASQAALARTRTDGDEEVAERFELFVDGVELANGYHELCDPEVLEQRTAEANRLRIADGKPPLPAPERLLAAMRAGLPPSSGVALGFDRLVMLATGADTLDQVLTFPSERA